MKDFTPLGFQRCGMASLSDLQSPQHKDIFATLEIEQKTFFEKQHHFRGKEYKWPADPLHTWSRVWEYPYTYHHLKQWRDSRKNTEAALHAIDLGSGVTFFPFSVAKLGYQVTCVDIDPIVDVDIARAARIVDQSPGQVDCRLCDNSNLPFVDGEVDAVYCLSVLEHVSDFENTIKEVFRVLKSSGVFILTIDMDMSGYVDIGINRYYDLRRCLFEHFDLKEPEITVHPLDMLQPRNGPFPYKTYSSWQVHLFHIRQRIKMFLGQKPLDYYRLPNLDLAIWGAVMTKGSRVQTLR